MAPSGAAALVTALALASCLSCSSANPAAPSPSTTTPPIPRSVSPANAGVALAPGQAAALGAALAQTAVKDVPGVTLPGRWPANLPRPANAALVLTSTTPADTTPPPGDWALFVAPGLTAESASSAYRSQLEAAGLRVREQQTAMKGLQFPELSVDVQPPAKVRLLQTDGGVAVIVGILS